MGIQGLEMSKRWVLCGRDQRERAGETQVMLRKQDAWDFRAGEKVEDGSME